MRSRPEGRKLSRRMNQKKHIDNGLCKHCSSPLISKTMCQYHLDIQRRNNINTALLKQINKYLISKGWNPLIIGFKGVKKRKLKGNYSLIIDFTGIKQDVNRD